MRILVVDDERNIQRTMILALESMGHESMAVQSGALAIRELKADLYDVVFLDLNLSQESGLDVLQDILRISPRTEVIMFTAFASVDTAVAAMRRGAFDYLPKPFTPDQIRQTLAHVERTRRLENRVAELESLVASSEGPEINLETENEAMQKVLDVAFKAANSDSTILLLGKTVPARVCWPGPSITVVPGEGRLLSRSAVPVSHVNCWRVNSLAMPKGLSPVLMQRPREK